MTRGRWVAVVGMILAAAMAVGWPQAASAETKAGDLDLSIAGSFSNISVDDSNTSSNSLTLATKIGYFFAPAHELSLAAFGGLVFANGQDNAGFYAVAARYDYHFNTQGTVIPYLGPQVGFLGVEAGGTSATGVLYGGQAGIKFFMTERTTFFVEYNFIRAELSSNGNATTGVNQNTVLVGISYIFR